MDTQIVPSRSLTGNARAGNRFGIWFKRGSLALVLLMLMLSMTGLVYQSLATRMDERRFLPPGQLTNVGEYMLHIHCVGDGSPTVVLEAGLGGTSLDWSLVQPELAKTTQVCSYDRAGLGWSEMDPENRPRTSEQIAEELHTLLRTTGITSPYVLAGLSAGGMHVQMYANRYPDEVVGVVLVDPTPAQLMATFSAADREALLPNLGQFRLIQKLEPFGVLRFLPLPGSEALENVPADVRDQIRAVNLRNGAAAALFQDAAGFEASILQTASLGPLPSDLPVTVIWHGIPAEPRQMDSVAETSLRKLVEGSPRGIFVIAENSGHYITFDRPDAVIAEIESMLRVVRLESQADMLKLSKAR